jgi:hypothetical protein
MDDPIIVIKHGNADGTLILSDNGYSTVDLYTRIRWEVDTASNVASIDKINNKHIFPMLFVLGPKRDGKSWTGKVVFRPQTEYEYYIKWTEKGTGITRTYDPKIAVRPTFDFLFWLIILLSAMLVITTTRFFIKKFK